MNGIFINVLGPNRAFVTRLVKEKEIVLMNGSDPETAIAWLGSNDMSITSVTQKSETRLGNQTVVDWEYVGQTDNAHKFRTKDGKMIFIPQTTQVVTSTKHVAKITYLSDQEPEKSYFREEVNTLSVSVLTVVMVREGKADIAEILQTNNRTGREFKRARIVLNGSTTNGPDIYYAASAMMMEERSTEDEPPVDISPGGVVEYSATIPKEVANQMMKNSAGPIEVSRVITLSRRTYSDTQSSQVEIKAHTDLMPGSVEMYDETGALIISGQLGDRSAAGEPTVIGRDRWVRAIITRDEKRFPSYRKIEIEARLVNNGTAPVRAIFRVQNGAKELSTRGIENRKESHIPGYDDLIYGNIEPAKSIHIKLIYFEE